MHRSLCPLCCQSWGIFGFMSLFLISQASTLHNVDYKYEKCQQEKSSGVLDNSPIKKIKDNSKPEISRFTISPDISLTADAPQVGGNVILTLWFLFSSLFSFQNLCVTLCLNSQKDCARPRREKKRNNFESWRWEKILGDESWTLKFQMGWWEKRIGWSNPRFGLSLCGLSSCGLG